MNSRALPILCFLALSSTAGAQGHARPTNEAPLQEWRARFGSRWSTRLDPVTGWAEMIYGGRATFDGTPRSDEEWTARAEAAILSSRDLHGVDVATLVADRVRHLPLGQIGSGDKWSVELRQEFGGIPVHDGRVVLLFDDRGALLSIQSHALVDVEGLDLEASFGAGEAREQARLAFEKEHAPTATSISTPTLVILARDAGAQRRAHLAWELDVQAEVQGSEPVGRRYWIDARSGAPLQEEASVHFFDVSGTVTTLATPGTQADSATNPETAQPAKYLRIQHSTGVVFTDVNGAFVIPGANTAQNVTLSYSGTFADVDDDPSGTPYTQAAVLAPGAGNAVLLNPGAVDAVTAQANIFNHVATVRDYVRRVNPSDSTADIVYVGHANIAATCNAYYNGNSINFYAAGGSCNNTAFSTVIGHEQGHWLNVLYGTGNGSDGMGEGNADVWTLYAYDTPLNGEGFFTSGGAVRTGTNTRQFCGDCDPGCWGEVHRDGEPWMGAAWKVRANLNTSLGNTAGDLVADQLFLAWMNAYNQTQIRSVIELQWLVLDDDDANLANGTPHATDIKNGFRAQGFPGYDIEFGTVTSIADQTCEQASYPVTANVHTVQGTTIASVTLAYRVNGGAWSNVALSPAGGDAWSGAIPYVASPATVEYEVRATDTGGNTKDALCAPRSFFIGQVLSFAADGFETTGGWTHGSVGDTSNANDDWQRGVPQGKSGTSQSVPWADPAAAAEGANCWGSDLGITQTGAGNGAYQADVHNYLRSPAFDCTGQTGVRLIFKRWLTVEKSQYDFARVYVNDVEVWRNPFDAHVLDAGWSQQSIDIGAMADGNASVVIQFDLLSDGGLQLGGWQIDDLKLGRIVAAPSCNPFQSFCAGDGSGAACPCANHSAVGNGSGCLSSLGVGGKVVATGGASVANDTVVLSGTAMPSAPALYFQGTAPQNGGLGVAFGDGLRCAAGTVVRLGIKTNVSGASQYPGVGDQSVAQRGLVPAAGGSRVYQVWYRNSATFCTASTFNLTNGVSIAWSP